MEALDEDFQDYCSICRTRQDSVLNLNEQVFFVNTAIGCGHKFCPMCVNREFHTKRQFACPRCRTIVAQSKLSKRSLDETQAEKDFGVRRLMKTIFNKTDADFDSINAFKDYEEMVEDYIYNLVHSIDVETTKAAIDRYKKTNTRLIAINQTKLDQQLHEEERSILEREEREQAMEKQFKESLIKELKKKKEQKKLQNQIMLGEASVQVSDGASRDVSATQSAAAGGAAAAIPTAAMPNTVLAFINQRALPAPIVDTQRKRPPIRSSEDIRKLHRAGGYDYGCYEARNWAQIRSELP